MAQNREDKPQTTTVPVGSGTPRAGRRVLDPWGGMARKVEHARQQLTNVFDAVDELMFIHDQNGRILRANRACAEYTGLHYREIIGKPYRELFSVQGGSLPAHGVPLADEDRQNAEIATADGHHFVCSTYPIADKSGNFLYTLSVMRDVTDEREAETGRNILAQALQQAAVGTALTSADPELVLTHVNDMLCELSGRSAEQLVGQPVRALLARGQGEALRLPGDADGEHQSWRGEVHLLNADGLSIPVQLELAAVSDESAVITGYVATFSDLHRISEARQYNQLLREVIEDLSTELDLDALGHKAVKAAVHLTGADLGAAVLPDRVSGLLFHRWPTGVLAPGWDAVKRGFCQSEGLIGVVLKTACTQAITDYPHFEHALAEYVQCGVQSVLIAPMIVGDQATGGLTVVSTRPGHRFSSDHIQVLESIANQLGVAVHRQQLIDNLVASESRFHHVVDAVPDVLFTFNPDTLYPTLVSPAVMDLLGFTPEEMIADPELWIRQLHIDDRGIVKKELAGIIRDGQARSLEMRLWSRDGKTLRWFSGRIVANCNADGIPVELVGVVSDITARKKAEEALAAERDFVTTILETTAALIVVMAPDGTIVRCNRACLTDFGYEAREVEGCSLWNLFVPEEQRSQVQAVFDGLVAERVSGYYENDWVTRDGMRRTIAWSNSTLTDADGQLRYVIATGVDITGKQTAERSLRESNRALRTLSACNEIMVRATDERVLLESICTAIVEVGGFSAAWVGYTGNESSAALYPVVQAGLVMGTVGGNCVAGVPCDKCPAQIAIETMRPVIRNDLEREACASPWVDDDSTRSSGSLIALPLTNYDRPLGVLVIYATEANVFNEEKVGLLTDLAEDLVYGIRSLRTELERTRLMEEQQLSAERQQQTLVKTIECLALALEKRDPYTSGHQQRVAELAVAIAEALGLSADRVEGIRLGALIHDVGKIYVPSEILNRPGRLNEAEFALIKTHSQVGFEIVQRVEFPWPVARMIRQHHERLDGSGYPDGLQGDEIILEARVLAVADVVEAMTSHRPYRPGLGIDAALAEVASHRGTHYDPEVVDVCLRVFREHGFAFGKLMSS